MRIRIQELTECVSSTKTLVDGTLKSIEKNFVFGGRLREQNDNKNIGQNKNFRKNFRKNENFS
jgi:hypothetical protein